MNYSTEAAAKSGAVLFVEIHSWPKAGYYTHTQNMSTFFSACGRSQARMTDELRSTFTKTGSAVCLDYYYNCNADEPVSIIIPESNIDSLTELGSLATMERHHVPRNIHGTLAQSIVNLKTPSLSIKRLVAYERTESILQQLSPECRGIMEVYEDLAPVTPEHPSQAIIKGFHAVFPYRL